MLTTNTYLNFDGDCHEAMTFYAKCLETEAVFTTFAEGPPEMAEAASKAPDRILHAELAKGPVVVMASDTLPGMPFVQGTNFSISLTCESQQEMDRVFSALCEGGKVAMPSHDAFWGGRFGMLTDRFGVSWMLSFRATES